MISELLERLRCDRPKLAPIRVWQAYQQLEESESKSPVNELVALVSLVRRVCGADEQITNYADKAPFNSSIKSFISAPKS